MNVPTGLRSSLSVMISGLLASTVVWCELAFAAARPVPDAPILEKALAVAREAFGQEIANAKRPDDKSLLSKKLPVSGEETRNDDAGQYALYSLALTRSNRERTY